VDIAPTILDRMGIDLATTQPPLDGESLRAPATKPVEKASAKSPNKKKKSGK
jgi:hypothetical protein